MWSIACSSAPAETTNERENGAAPSSYLKMFKTCGVVIFRIVSPAGAAGRLGTSAITACLVGTTAFPGFRGTRPR